jgi:hypothetical protein
VAQMQPCAVACIGKLHFQDRRIRPLCHPSDVMDTRVVSLSAIVRGVFCSRSCSNAVGKYGSVSPRFLKQDHEVRLRNERLVLAPRPSPSRPSDAADDVVAEAVLDVALLSTPSALPRKVKRPAECV